jgi:hypothetical protein
LPSAERLPAIIFLKTFVPSYPEQVVTLRRLKVLTIVLVLSNFLLGAFSVYLIRRTDRDYSLLIGESVPALYEGRHVGQQMGIVYRSIIAALIAKDPAVCAAQIARARQALTKGKELREQLLQLDMLQKNPSLARELEKAGEDFAQAASDLLPRITPDDTADSERDRLDHMQQLYERHIASLEQIATMAAGHAELSSEAYSDLSRSRSELVLGLASWPLVLAGLIVGLTVVIVLIMLVVFRQAVIGDEP